MWCGSVGRRQIYLASRAFFFHSFILKVGSGRGCVAFRRREGAGRIIQMLSLDKWGERAPKAQRPRAIDY